MRRVGGLAERLGTQQRYPVLLQGQSVYFSDQLYPPQQGKLKQYTLVINYTLPNKGFMKNIALKHSFKTVF